MSEELECNECGKKDYHTSYTNGNEKKTMDAEGVCFNCAFWLNLVPSKRLLVIDGVGYEIGSGSGGGMAGRKFTVKKGDGEQVETNDLWCRGRVPNHFRDRLPDNAEFLGGAQAHKSADGDVLCFSPST